MGRAPSERWGPRSIDIDILLYDDEHIDSADLTVPHRELWNRRFVLAPLRDVASDALLVEAIDTRLRELGDAAAVRLLERETRR
ncbi:MAG: 2-amino-4-hydroxy-6-hydroxymethyldihydropteridine diphosphokinase [Chloroflexota bacterium]|nr:2-amino-4-hydroxy-6-hydroxymethyldihydropteridine diphosphokinase [Chloroflexota bacterium]